MDQGQKNTANPINYHHIPVLLQAVVTWIPIMPGEWYIDATFGGGGYTLELLKRGAKVIALDVDIDALQYGRKRLSEVSAFVEGRDYHLLQASFKDIHTIPEQVGRSMLEIAGVVFDLGISSYQLDTPERGFSFRYPYSPLDMRMQQQGTTRTAAQIVQEYPEEELYEIIAQYGEEKRARSISRAIVSSRRINPLRRVGDLMQVLESCVPERERIDTYARVFQALRIVVNNELEALTVALQSLLGSLRSGAYVGVVSFHSLEDRRVKLAFMDTGWQHVTKKPIRADEQEIHMNPRARSAKLRVARKK